MLEFLIDNIFDATNDAPLLSDLFLHSYEADLIQRKRNRLTTSFNLSFRSIDDVLSLNNPSFKNCIHRIYHIELEIKDTTDTVNPATYLDLQFEIDSEGKLLTKLYDKRNDVLSTFLSSVATSLQHLCMEFSYHNSYVIPELAVTTQTFCIALDYL